MDVLATLMNDMKQAMRDHDKTALEAVRFLMSEVKNAQIDKPEHAALTDNEFFAIVKKNIKNTEEAVEQYRAGGREDLVEAELPKIELMRRYLPAQMSEAEVKAIVDRVRAEHPDLAVGPLTGMVMKETAGKADGSLVSKLIRG